MIHRLLRRRDDDARSEAIWLTVYSDLITNLVLVFLALYGVTTMGSEAYSKALESMKLTDIKTENTGPVLTLEDVAQILQQEFRGNPNISVSEAPGVTRIELGESVLFNSGGAQLKASSRPVLQRVAQILSLLPYTLIIEGHTDSLPLRPGSIYKDNNELSMARAMAVVRLLINEEKIPAGQLAAAAYGPIRPRASNLLPSSRRLNRRVEIALFKDVPYVL